jgi:hypothetical protein
LQIAEGRFELDFSMKRAISGLRVTDGGGKVENADDLTPDRFP